MNEFQRSAYLNALGIESYAPRWRLSYARESSSCILPLLDAAPTPSGYWLIEDTSPTIRLPQQENSGPDKNLLVEVIRNLEPTPKSNKPIDAASILNELDGSKAKVVSPFSLSVWRPCPGFLIIDERVTHLALPTDLLLNNLLHGLFPGMKLSIEEEVLRWPMVENRFVSRTEDDARSELQTWLAVEHELRPINRLWLMGNKAAQYFYSEDVVVGRLRWSLQKTSMPINGQALSALLLPSLNELLQTPLDKARLWQVC